MKKKPVDVPDQMIFKIKKKKISDQKILQHWTGVLDKISDEPQKTIINKPS